MVAEDPVKEKIACNIICLGCRVWSTASWPSARTHPFEVFEAEVGFLKKYMIEKHHFCLNFILRRRNQEGGRGGGLFPLKYKEGKEKILLLKYTPI